MKVSHMFLQRLANSLTQINLTCYLRKLLVWDRLIDCFLVGELLPLGHASPR